MKLKAKLTLLTSTLFSLASIASADTLPSPDGQYTLKTGQGIEITDSSGQPVLTLVDHLAGSDRLEVAWSADSKRVVVATNAGRGSAVLAAWHDGPAWHKTIEQEQDSARFVGWLKARVHSDIVSEHRELEGWTGPDALTVKCKVTFERGLSIQYQYLLTFTSSQVRLDRGGFEEGAVKASDFKEVSKLTAPE
jgi:hypothetical protein